MATGHSLGGGLASGAAVVANIEADTFNSSGLQRHTLDDPNVGGEAFPGAYARYDSGMFSQIDAYYICESPRPDGTTDAPDVLSFLQDETPLLPNALGRRRPLEGLYNLTEDERGYAAAVADVMKDIVTPADITSVGIIDALSILYAGYGDIKYSANDKMISSHSMDSLIFGLLHEDGQWNYYDDNEENDD